ncbi:MAG TPA: DUF6036 family nucleotidyltransferase [Polyangia bacterium]|nr:DUF6036 family nucleotidyltransferase [Polyangia bacterium]
MPGSVEKAALEILNQGDEFVPIGSAGVADLPYEAEGRFRPAPLGLKKLEVLVPERYDLALSKTVRGYAHDFEAIEEMHKSRRFPHQDPTADWQTGGKSKMRNQKSSLIPRL